MTRDTVTMKGVLLLTVVFLRCEGAVVGPTPRVAEGNERPIVGVLAQEQSYHLRDKYPENYTSYIAASYVKDVEAAGARVVPIMIGKGRSYYRELIGKLNGVLFPGGATYFNHSDGYADAGQHIYELATELNAAGDHFPVFGTCLGFELLVILASGRGKKENRVTCHAFDNLPLRFTNDYRSSKMFEHADEDVVELLANDDLAVNAHQFCIVDENIKAYNLTRDWRVTSHSEDAIGVKFIASIEHKRYPFYGVQFHPEKTYEWVASKNYPHSRKAARANRYFMDFFVDECRRNRHSFASAAEENQYLIYNHAPHFTGALGSIYQQCYFFEPQCTVSNKI